MSLLSDLALGFSVALTLTNLFYCTVGVVVGTAIGVLPGVGPLVTIAVLLPLTFGLPADSAMIMLAGIYYGAAYGGSTTAILVNLPGEQGAAVTVIDGYQMARQGRAGPALAIAAIGSFVAGCFGTFLIAVLALPLTQVALKFGAPEFTSLIVLALVATAVLVHGSMLKGVAVALFGVLVGLAGIDLTSGIERFTFGVPGLYEGIPFVVVAMGLFAFAEIIRNLEHAEQHSAQAIKVTSLMPTRADLKASWKPILRGTAIGSFFGILPGAGQTIASFGAYAVERRISKTPERFGKGAIEGVAAPEAANNASAQCAFIPTLTLGIPGSGTMALMLGALMIQGITPGPRILTSHPELFWGLIASMWIGNLLLVILNLPLVGLWVSMLKIPYRWLFPIILVFSCIGIYTVNQSAIDIWVMVTFGVVGYIFVKLDCEPAPFILGLLLGPLLETNMRRSLLLSHGDFTTFLTHPISAAFLLAAIGLIALLVIPAVRRRKEDATVEEE
jgi:putative tricarboxylic transport membrane protein